MQKNTDTRSLAFLFCAFFCGVFATGADILFKYLALSGTETRIIGSVLQFRLYKNLGVAFDLPLPFPLIALFTVFIFAGLLFFLTQQRQNYYLTGSVLLILFGGMNNFVDRLLNGFTTDYLIIFERSAINIADLLIIFGTLLVLWYTKDKKVI